MSTVVLVGNKNFHDIKLPPNPSGSWPELQGGLAPKALGCWLLAHWTVSSTFQASLSHVRAGHSITWFPGISPSLARGWLALPSWKTERSQSALAPCNRGSAEAWGSPRGGGGWHGGAGKKTVLTPLCSSPWLWMNWSGSRLWARRTGS